MNYSLPPSPPSFFLMKCYMLILKNKIRNIHNILNLNDSRFYCLLTFLLTIQKIHLFQIPRSNISSHLRDLKHLFVIPFDIYTWLFSYFHFFSSFLIFIRLFPNIIFGIRLFFILSLCKYIFQVKKAWPNYLTKLTYTFVD